MSCLLRVAMKWLCCIAVLLAPLAGCRARDDEERAAQDWNVNSRYIVESVKVSGQAGLRVGEPLRTAMNRLVGTRLDRPALEKLADRIKSDLQVSGVAIKVARGAVPDHVAVNFEVTKANEQVFDADVAKLLYNSTNGWNGEGRATVNFRGNAFTFGLVSDNDTLVGRYAGIRTSFERKAVGTDRVRVRFEFDDFREQFNAATVALAGPGEIYSNRQSFMPEATVILAEPLEASFGVSFARLRVPFAGAAAAKTESSNAVVSTLRYHQRWGSEQDTMAQSATASYSVESATNVLGTDAVFTRHRAEARYKLRRAHHTIEIGFLTGTIDGHAPLYERFVLGDSATLRGWNRFDLDPLGGSHVIHGSIDYGYRFLQIFYDTGAVWDQSRDRAQKQSAGVGFKVDKFQLAVAFPIRSGRADPVFYAGMNFQ